MVDIKENNGIFNFDGDIVHGKVLWDRGVSKSWCIGDKELEQIRQATGKSIERLTGHQLKYIYIIDKSCEIIGPTMDFNEIDKQGAGMYLGKKITLAERKG